MNLRVIILILAVIGLAGACKNHSTHTAASESYTCPMHPQIIKSEPGNCPICGMTLVKREGGDSREVVNDTALSVLLKPTNEVVVSSLPTVSVRNEQVPLTIKVLGTVAYD
uniref:heavy metal-binding domain-containing protein n=1 Tax=Chitinophaga sp. TaxID=1869181 RepID=UPI0031DE5664